MSAKSPARPASQAAPPSSPRLPSPPPLPELQLGPRSPSVNAPAGELELDNVAAQDDGATRRVRPGTSGSDMARGPPFVPLHQLESPFQLQEYLKSLYCNVTRDDASNMIKPITKESATQLASPPIQQDTGEPVDRNLWLYELCRFLVQRTNRLIVSFFADNPPCSNQTCPEMRASEWQYLCAVHEPPKSCCAIDYCCHTLDWATNVLTSTKHFPSRLSLGGEGGSPFQSMRQLTNIFRRVYRIYAHAWFQHREAFWMLEQEEGLYKFFRTVCDAYALIPEDNYTIPPEAEGDREEFLETPISQRGSQAPFEILRNDTPINSTQQPSQQPSPPRESEPEPESGSDPASTSTLPTTTTRRHRHTPSTGTQVTMIAEGSEEEEDDAAKASSTQISQEVSAEPTTTSSTPLASTFPPGSQSRSPRPHMSIPITNSKAEILKAPEDPTPTPEHHDLDPFSDTNSAETASSTTTAGSAAQPSNANATEQDKPLDTSATTAEATTSEPSKPPTAPDTNTSAPPSKISIPPPPLQTFTPPRVLNENEEVMSPGGGSIRTVGGDILSGILAHTDVDDDYQNQKKDDSILSSHTNATSSANVGGASSESKWNVVDAAKEQKDESHVKTEDETSNVEGGKVKAEREGENDEDMGEIKLDKTKTTIKAENANANEQPEVEKKKDVDEEKDHLNAKEEQEAKDDGTTTEETPAGVI